MKKIVFNVLRAVPVIVALTCNTYAMQRGEVMFAGPLGVHRTASKESFDAALENGDVGKLSSVLREDRQLPLRCITPEDCTSACESLLDGVEIDPADGVEIDPVDGVEIDPADGVEIDPAQSIELVEKLIAYGANPDFKEMGNCTTPLYRAVARGDKKVVEFLLKLRGNGVEIEDEIGNKKIIKANINLNVQDYHKNTPLHVAAEKGFLDLVQLLLENGANKNLCNDAKQRPAACAKTEAIRKIIENYGKK